MKIAFLPLAGAALALAACSGGAPKSRPAPLSAAPERGTIARVATLLDAGDESGARKELKAILKASPDDPNAILLRDSISRDPVELLGPKSFNYTVKPGETMIELADRFLGNRLKSYQLARYNGIETPAALASGTTLRIPGEAPRPAPAPVRAEPKPKPSKATGSRAEGKVERPTRAAPATPVANPAAAARARAAGLAALNQGKVAQAVVSLRRARALDPTNPLIQRDLARAERITAAVRAKR